MGRKDSGTCLGAVFSMAGKMAVQYFQYGDIYVSFASPLLDELRRQNYLEVKGRKVFVFVFCCLGILSGFFRGNALADRFLQLSLDAGLALCFFDFLCAVIFFIALAYGKTLCCFYVFPWDFGWLDK